MLFAIAAQRAPGATACLPAPARGLPAGVPGHSRPGSRRAPEDTLPLTLVTGPRRREAAEFGAGEASGDPPNEGQTLRSESSAKGLQGYFQPRKNKP